MPVPKRSFMGSASLPVWALIMSATAWMMPSPMGNIIAVVAVLLIHMETKAAVPPYTRRMRAVLLPTQDMERILKAKRLSSPCAIIASARMKLPRNRNTVGSAKGAKAVATGATPSSTHSTAPRTAVIGMGIGSVTQ